MTAKTKQQRQLIQPFVERGWTVEHRSKHLCLVCPVCAHVQAIPSTGEGRSHRNVRSRLLAHERSHDAHQADRP